MLHSALYRKSLVRHAGEGRKSGLFSGSAQVPKEREERQEGNSFLLGIDGSIGGRFLVSPEFEDKL